MAVGCTPVNGIAPRALEDFFTPGLVNDFSDLPALPEGFINTLEMESESGSVAGDAPGILQALVAGDFLERLPVD